MLEKKLSGIFLNPVFGSFRRYLSLWALVGASILGCSGSSNSAGKADEVTDDANTWGNGFSQENNSPDTYSTLKETKSGIQQICFKDNDKDGVGSSDSGWGEFDEECPSGWSSKNGDCDDGPDGGYIHENCPKNDADTFSSNADVSMGIDTLTDTYTGKKIVEITAGYWHACARTITNDVYCWGYNEQGQVGDETNLERHLPVKVHGLAGYTIKQLSAGAAYTCAIADTISEKGVVLCWGDNGLGQSGIEKSIISTNTPIPVEGLVGKMVTQVATGANHTLFLINDGSIYACGYNTLGAVTGGESIVTTPTLVTGTGLEGKVVTDVAAGASVSFTVTSAGEGYSWGINLYGDLGYGIDDTYFIQNTPAQIKYLNGMTIGGKVTKISTKINSVFALLNTGKIVFWGDNKTGNALLGNTNFKSYFEPIVLEDLVEGELVTQISCGEGHTFFTLSNGQTGGSGYGGYGELGTGNTNDVYSKEKITWLYGGDRIVKQVATGRNFTLVLLDDGSVQSMGYNLHGEGGIGTTEDIYVPTPVLFLTD